MGLTAEEKAQLEALSKKAKEPDAPRGNIDFSLNLSDDNAVQRAIKYGLLPPDDEPADNGDDDDAETPPKRPGFFEKS